MPNRRSVPSGYHSYNCGRAHSVENGGGCHWYRLRNGRTAGRRISRSEDIHIAATTVVVRLLRSRRCVRDCMAGRRGY